MYAIRSYYAVLLLRVLNLRRCRKTATETPLFIYSSPAARPLCPYLCTLTRVRIDVEHPTRELGTLTHAVQAEASVLAAAVAVLLHIEATAIVADRQCDVLRFLGKRQIHPISAGVLGDIVERLLHDAVNHHLERLRDIVFRNRHLLVERDVRVELLSYNFV